MDAADKPAPSSPNATEPAEAPESLQDPPQEASRPPRLLVFDNPDKKGHRRAGPHDAAPNWPFRLLLSGPPGSGKRNMLLNLIFQLLDPPPSAIHIVHYAPDTTEYDVLEDLGIPIMFYDVQDFPCAENLSKPEEPRIGEHDPLVDPDNEPVAASEARSDWGASPLVIIDEVTADTLSPENKHRLERLLNYCSTHHNTSVAYSIQSAMSVPPPSRRAFDHYCLWKQHDSAVDAMIASRAGVPPSLLHELFDSLCKIPHDCIWIDSTRPADDPYRFRLNMLSPISFHESIDAW
jgi:DNA polymerase III delta prime subunit